MELMTSWERRGLEQGLQQGLEQGVQQGKAELIARLAGVRFGRLPARLERGLAALSSDRLDALGEALLDMRDLKELKAWLDQAKEEQSR